MSLRRAVDTASFGSISWFVVPITCWIEREELARRLAPLNLTGCLPGVRGYRDAMRKALEDMASESYHHDEQAGTAERYIVADIPADRGNKKAAKLWEVHKQVCRVLKTEKGEQVLVPMQQQEDFTQYPKCGLIALTDPQKNSDMPTLEVKWNGSSESMHQQLLEGMLRFRLWLDHDKIRDCCDRVLEMPQVAAFDIKKGVKFIRRDALEFLRRVAAEVFGVPIPEESLPEGAVVRPLPFGAVNFEELPLAASAAPTLRRSVQRTITETISAIQQGLVAGSTAAPATLTEWLRQLENLKANMALMNQLEVQLPENLEGLEERVQQALAETQVAAGPRRRTVG